MEFSKLRLTGFKSFVEPAELLIERGMTGIVGPNGCGKSNLVEALRWVMGESSAKQMRGGAMDDVIFSGAADRPARNVAEVILTLDNAERDAPSLFNDFSELEVARRIEREQGSAYRINGRETRARDVQLLFADVATGAHSSGLVSQGEISAIIRSKPAERRRLLEEAAGISGLHSRRHEAELKLRGAETNLERLDDVIAAFEAQLQGLKRQARQANRYRRLSGHIRKAQAMLFHLRWIDMESRIADTTGRLEDANHEVAELTREAAAAATARGQADDALPTLRQAEAEAAAAFHRLEVERDGLAAQEARLARVKQDLETRIQQLDRDLQREQSLQHDATEAAARLGSERMTLARSEEDKVAAEAEAGAAADSAAAALAKVEEDLARLTERIAVQEAERHGLERRLSETAVRRKRIEAEREELSAERVKIEARAGDGGALGEAVDAYGAAKIQRDEAREALDAAQGAHTHAEQAERAARDRLQAAETKRDRLRAEEAALASLLESGGAPSGPPVFDDVVIEAGYEAALGAAFGDELSASIDETAPVHWARVSGEKALGPLPKGTVPLSEFVRAPAALERRLSQIGVVEAVKGPRLRKSLQPGQCLVSQDGALWRWDGYTVAAEAPVAAATRLRQRNRLIEVRRKLKPAEAAMRKAETTYSPAQQALEQGRHAESVARDRFRETDSALTAAQEARDAELEKNAADRSRLEALADAARRLEAEQDESAAGETEAGAAIAALPDLDKARREQAGLRETVAERRKMLADCQAAHSRILRELQIRVDRLAAIECEVSLWSGRAEDATRRLTDLAERRNAAQAEVEALAEQPAAIEERRQALLSGIGEAEARRKEAADALASAEGEANRLDARARDADHALAESREARVRIESALEQARQAQSTLVEQIAEKVEGEPVDLLEIAEIGESDSLPDFEKAENRVERLLRERDNMGPVNLRAETEAAELDGKIAALQGERADLDAAIARLHQGIANLNREGRERVATAFTQIDGHFRRLFAQLFGGGSARLALVESDDPLEAGLELIATPPGKQTRVLSLLSGGEQALTALTLLFAVFLTNPAPICVLDEADAPLDDANVERFCDLIESIARDTGTRFLVITHNRITMARVDRLYGVTMAERGVSQLVSVDLGAAEQLQESA